MYNTEDFFKNYRGRYSQYWIERWGLIPELPTSFDNANSVYELVAWLQRAFKNLLDDFQQLEGEYEDFKNAIIDLLEYLIPELIRRYHDSAEFRAIFISLLEDILAGEERTWVKDLLKELIEVDMREWIEAYLKELLTDLELQEFFEEVFKVLLTDLQNQVNSNKASIATTDARIDNLIANAGDGTVPSELMDLRVAYNGKTYTTAGDAVRKQFIDISNFLDFTVETTFIVGEYVNAVTGELLYDVTVATTDFIDLSDFKGTIFSEIFIVLNHHATFFDSNKNFISGTTSNVVGQWAIPIPSGAKYAKVAFHHTEINKAYIKKTDKESVMGYFEEVKSAIGTFIDFRVLWGEYYNVNLKEVIKMNEVNTTDFIDLSTFKGKLYTVVTREANHHVAFFDTNKNFISGAVSAVVGSWAIPIPSGAKYAKVAFYNEDKEAFYVRKLATDNIFDALPENYTRSLKGKKLGIIGDSISTYNGYIPTGYNPFYPANNVTSVDLTWWKQLINNTGMQLCVNASWSGSTIAGNQDDTTGSIGCSDARVNALTASNGDVPDIILVYIGINDFGKNNGIVCGNYRGKTAISQERNVTSISDAFGILLSKLQTKYPKAQIFVSRVMPEQYAGSMAESHVNGFPNINPNDNVSLPAFNEQLEDIASAFNCPVIPMDKAGITFFNVSQYTGDNLHPNATYMTMMSKMAQKTLEKNIY